MDVSFDCVGYEVYFFTAPKNIRGLWYDSKLWPLHVPEKRGLDRHTDGQRSDSTRDPFFSL